MTIQGSAYESWLTLDTPWREAFAMAWDSFRDGGIAVGAVLTDSSGKIIGRGRNQRFGSAAPQSLLAHAEMEALSALPPRKDRARDVILYTTLRPCPMCLGAVVVARVGQVRFAALDPTWLGIEQSPGLNEEVRRRWPTIIGPLNGPLGEWAAILPCLNTSGSLIRAMETVAPRRVERARAVMRRLESETSLPETAGHALEYVWDLLADHTE
jgi:tRNA(Arg) A34 adenosine deaminase TadA